MKNSQYRLTQKRRKLNEMRRKGVTEANWKLDRESYDYLSKYFPIEPARYLVQTRKYMETAGFPRILKVIDRAAHNGKAVIDTTLTKKTEMFWTEPIFRTMLLGTRLIYRQM